ncbi:MAG TPA: DNA repair protein RecO [Candidatus Acidoferrales bacterium]|jgi:DNA repair protein RecO (recombination protein O)|nr:DNA repair protein RecO [Candidatus Acidoferrales bacterium]
MTESASGIILRTRPLTETSLIVHWLSPNLGRLATVAKGARRAKSPYVGKLDLFYEADFSFSRSRSSELHTLREVRLRKTNSALREDILKLRQAAYAAAFIVQATETETPLTVVYELLEKFLESLCAHEPLPQLILAFELKMLEELGLEPDWSEAKLSAGAQKIVSALKQRTFAAAFGLKLADNQASELRQFLHGFMVYHLGKVPQGRAQALMTTHE